MEQCECERCGQRAVYHVTTIEHGIACVRHLCPSHGQPEYSNALPPQEFLAPPPPRPKSEWKRKSPRPSRRWKR